LVENNRIKDLFNKYGEKFAKKILSNTEMNEFIKSSSPINYLSKNFASKEALSKALGTGLYREGLYPSQITVTHADSGKPFFIMNSLLIKLLDKLSANSLFLSISDSDEHAVAIVIME
jgi:holo-[acyl-carrier protein] synthase